MAKYKCLISGNVIEFTNQVDIDSMVLVEQLGIRSQTQYKQEYLGTLFTADTIYGVKALRTNATSSAANASAAFALAVPA